MERIKNISDFFAMYVDGFKNLTWGRQLWILIFIKLFFMFAVVRVFFFPRVINQFKTKTEKIEHVTRELTKDHN